MKEIDLKELQSDIDSFGDRENFLFESMQIEREFISNLVNVRKSKGITQKELAKRTGLTQQVISNIEKMDRKPTLPNLIKYLLGLNLNINRIFK